MICYLDRTFCSSSEHLPTCRRQFTEEHWRAAKAWWGDDDPPVAFSNFCDTVTETAFLRLAEFDAPLTWEAFGWTFTRPHVPAHAGREITITASESNGMAWISDSLGGVWLGAPDETAL